MSFRCQVCGTPQPTGTQPKKVYRTHMVRPSLDSERMVSQIAEERNACAECALKPLEEVFRERYRKPAVCKRIVSA